MRSLKSLLNKRKSKKIISLADKDVFFVFKKIIKNEFGQLGLGKFKPDYYKKGTIFIKAESSVWANELFSNRNKIIRGINKELGKKIIKEIKLK